MYSPQIDPKLIPIIYQKAKEAKTPMTKYVNAILREKLVEQVHDKPVNTESSISKIKSKVA